jgi:hypothetical protein
MNFRQIIIIILLTTGAFSARARGETTWFDDLVQMREARQAASSGKPRPATAPTLGAKAYTFAAQPIEALVNRELLAESRILKAPLARSAGGWG